MKNSYESPDFEIIKFSLTDVVLASTEGAIGETIVDAGGSGTEIDLGELP